ncbi:MAG: hypothetical protein KKA73_21530 [Chloroflexi bacterium]|nr:hypothetical protein [Chloroflexota bacterium]MBU1750276.1 hypothetical protein [Chloroflexota bacterium]MBU1878831.1 hypothetical protein [Chloroflexota bacterium]
MSDQTRGQIIGVGLVLGAGLTLAGVGLLAFIIANTSPIDARMWAFLATLGMPLGGLAGYWLGRVEARGRVAGIDQGIERVSRAANDTATLRVNVAHAMRAPAQSPATIIELPTEPVFRDVPRLPSGVEEL